MQDIIKEDISLICSENLPWENLQHKRILITGANGFLGTYIVLSLMKCNQRYKTDIIVNALCRNKQKAYEKFNVYLNDDNLHFIFQDVCEEIDDSYESDIIIHAASPANPYIIQRHPNDVVDANVIGYSKLLKKAQEWGTKEVILFSSSAVYGYATPMEGVDENHRDCIDFTNYKDVYCISKQMCEMMSICYARTYNIQTKIIRPFVIYGPGDDLTSNKGMIDFLNDCIRNRNIVMKSKGEAIRSYVYIRDAIRAFYYILLKGKNDAYNISSVENIYSMNQIAAIFCKYNKKITIEYKLENKEYLKTRFEKMIGKNEKLRNLGWHETVGMEEGIYRTIKWGKSVLAINGEKVYE